MNRRFHRRWLATTAVTMSAGPRKLALLSGSGNDPVTRRVADVAEMAYTEWSEWGGLTWFANSVEHHFLSSFLEAVQAVEGADNRQLLIALSGSHILMIVHILNNCKLHPSRCDDE